MINSMDNTIDEIDEDTIREEMILMWSCDSVVVKPSVKIKPQKKGDIVKSLMESPMLFKIRQRSEQ